MGTRKVSVILAARDRMTAVLAPVLGEELALERANNIAQVLLYSSLDPAGTAARMLGETGLRDVQRVAALVGEAWRQGCEAEVA